MIDEKIAVAPLPAIAKAVNQLTSSQAIRALLVVISVGTMTYLVIIGREIPDTITAILFAVVGYYFGEAVPIPENQQRN